MTALHQTRFDLDVPFGAEALAPAIPDDAVEHGEVFTRRWVVELILDLTGYTTDADLATSTAVEPACGSGAFLVPMAERLSASCRRHGRPLTDAAGAIVAFDLLQQNVDASRRTVTAALVDLGWPLEDAANVVEGWVTRGDYLLRKPTQQVDFVIGNPPYVRLEDVPEGRMAAYRSTCPTMVGRADLYVGFLELGLRSLRPGGTLGFICADRWMRNQYGRLLRRLVADGHSLDVNVAMHDVDAFEDEVSAYPAVTVIRAAPQGQAVVAQATAGFGPADAKEFVGWVGDGLVRPLHADRVQAARLPHWFTGEDSWPTGSPARLAMIEDLAERFPPLEDPATGTRVGIGVATGADAVFVTEGADIEDDRLLPLSMVRDTTSGTLRPPDRYLVNPWGDDGRLVDLDAHPRLRAYFEANAAALRGRSVAKRLPRQWYRTIDKVDRSLTARPKLLFPDLKLTIHPTLDPGGTYPHHNLYYVVSSDWDPRVLGGLLLSRVANAFVEAYAVRMRGGTLRFQAQYLRRIRVPRQADILGPDRVALAAAFERRDVEAATAVALRPYGLADLPDWASAMPSQFGAS